MAQAVECLLGKVENLTSNPNTHTSPTQKNEWAGGVDQVVDCLPSMHSPRVQSPVLPKNNNKKDKNLS
jgi:hypothetical protein